MTKDDQVMLSALRERLADKVGRDRYDLWFSTGIELSFSDRTLCITAEQSFALERIRKTFRADLELVAAEVFGGVTG